MAQGLEFTPEQKESIIESLQTYLELGFSRNKACSLIGLDPTTLSKWVKADESLSMKLEGWENAINKLALQNITDAIQKEGEMDDPRKETTKWWAERKMKLANGYPRTQKVLYLSKLLEGMTKLILFPTASTHP